MCDGIVIGYEQTNNIRFQLSRVSQLQNKIHQLKKKMDQQATFLALYCELWPGCVVLDVSCEPVRGFSRTDTCM